MSRRSLRVAPEYIKKVKSALARNSFPSQQALATELGLGRDTVSKFFNGKPIDRLNLIEISEKLGLDWQEIVYREDETSTFVYIEHYIERPPIESLCEQEILKPGSLIRIIAVSKMGKTLLMARLLNQFKKRGNYRTVYLSLDLAEEKDFHNLDTFLQWFCFSVGKRLELPNNLADFWDEGSPKKMNCTECFERFLTAAESSLVLCLDKVDRIFPYQKVAPDFFILLRAWHEQAKTSEIWQRLRLIIAYSTPVPIHLDIHQSPFNVGLPINLPELELKQVKKLSQHHGLDWTDGEIKQLMDMVGGHPYLVDQAFHHIRVSNNSLKQFLQTAPTEEGIYRNHLRQHLRVIQEHSLVEAMRKVVNAINSVYLNVEQKDKLYSIGLVCFQRNEVVIRCNLYRQYFRDALSC